jgi:hypothetical protein
VPLIRCGRVEPGVSAPTTRPSARPSPVPNQEAISLIPARRWSRARQS